MTRTRTWASAAAAAITLTVVSATLATAAPPAGRPSVAPAALSFWGFVVDRAPGAPAGAIIPAPVDRGNVSGAVNTINHTGVGQYKVRMPGIGTSGGVVHVVALDKGPRICWAKAWYGVVTDEIIDVRCISNAGALVNSPFVATYLSVMGVGGIAPVGYLVADKPGILNYGPAANHQYDSTGGAVTVHRNGVGWYTAKLAGLGTSKGNVEVSATGSQPRHCAVSGWADDGAGNLKVGVRCRDRLGNPRDTKFAASFTNGAGLKGDGWAPVAYLYANQPVNPGYAPPAARSFLTAAGPIAIQHVGLGKYKVTLNGVLDLGGAAIVTGYGAGGPRCVMTQIDTVALPYELGVRCFDSSGSPSNQRFVLSWLR